MANILNAAETITFDPTVFATPQTITLTAGQLELSDTGGTETITGPAAGVTVSGGGASRVFQVESGVSRRPSRPDHHRRRSTTGSGGGLYNDGTADADQLSPSAATRHRARRRPVQHAARPR